MDIKKAMIVENKSNKIIGIGLSVALLPGDRAVVPKQYEKNPIVLRDIAKGRLALIQEAVTENQGESNTDGEPGTQQDSTDLSSMTLEELTAYAQLKGIDLGKATTVEGILKKIEDALGA